MKGHNPMTTLQFPALESRLLHTVRDEAASSVEEWRSESVRLCLTLFENVQSRVSENQREMEKVLEEGIEPRLMISIFGSLKGSLEGLLDDAHELVETISNVQRGLARSELLPEAIRMERAFHNLRDLVTDALAHTSEPPAPVDWDRIEEAKEDFKAGRKKRICWN
jgi:hypothetical protein